MVYTFSQYLIGVSSGVTYTPHIYPYGEEGLYPLCKSPLTHVVFLVVSTSYLSKRLVLTVTNLSSPNSVHRSLFTSPY